jgi:HAD superfamily hydrolase (TIGR01549 family)
MKDNYEKAREDYFDFYTNRHKDMVDAYPGIIEILEFIKSKKIPVSIYTGKGRESSEITLKKTGLYDFFDMIVTGDDIQGCKPSPEGIIKFASSFNLNPGKILMIGDAPADIIAARSAGSKVASVIWDSYDKKKVLEMKSDYVFENTASLLKFLQANL